MATGGNLVLFCQEGANEGVELAIRPVIPRAAHARQAFVEYITVGNIIYTITTGYNDTVNIIDGGGDNLVTVPEGLYTAETFTSALSAAFNSAVAGVTCQAFSDVTSKIVAVNGSAGEITIEWSASPQLARVAGAGATDMVIAAAGTSTFPHVPILNEPFVILQIVAPGFVHSPQLPVSLCRDGDTPRGFVAYLDDNRSYSAQFTTITHAQTALIPAEGISRAQIRIFRPDGTSVSNNGAQVQIRLRF